MDNKTWFKQAKFGMMIHFGLYSIPGGEWKGERMDDIGEWLQAHFRIPCAEYSQLAKDAGYSAGSGQKRLKRRKKGSFLSERNLFYGGERRFP